MRMCGKECDLFFLIKKIKLSASKECDFFKNKKIKLSAIFFFIASSECADRDNGLMRIQRSTRRPSSALICTGRQLTLALSLFVNATHDLYTRKG